MDTLTGVSLAEFQDILHGAGFETELVHEEADLAVLRTSARHLAFIVVLQGEVVAGRYGSAQCIVGFNDLLLPDQVNEWNKSRRFTRVYAMDDGSPFIEMDFLTIGITPQTIQSYLGLWLMSLHDFSEMFG